MCGNEALGEASIRAGLDAYFGYPITPQNEVPAYMARRMQEAGLQGVSRWKKTHTTTRSENPPDTPDLVQRDFRAAAPDVLWVADITYIPTWAGFLYLAVVLRVAASRLLKKWPKSSKVELAKRLQCDEKEVRRLLDPRHPSKLPRIEAALEAVGRQLVVGLQNAA